MAERVCRCISILHLPDCIKQWPAPSASPIHLGGAASSAECRAAGRQAATQSNYRELCGIFLRASNLGNSKCFV